MVELRKGQRGEQKEIAEGAPELWSSPEVRARSSCLADVEMGEKRAQDVPWGSIRAGAWDSPAERTGTQLIFQLLFGPL